MFLIEITVFSVNLLFFFEITMFFIEFDDFGPGGLHAPPIVAYKSEVTQDNKTAHYKISWTSKPLNWHGI